MVLDYRSVSVILGVGAYERKPSVKERLGLAVGKELDRTPGETAAPPAIATRGCADQPARG